MNIKLDLREIEIITDVLLNFQYSYEGKNFRQEALELRIKIKEYLKIYPHYIAYEKCKFLEKNAINIGFDGWLNAIKDLLPQQTTLAEAKRLFELKWDEDREKLGNGQE